MPDTQNKEPTLLPLLDAFEKEIRYAKRELPDELLIPKAITFFADSQKRLSAERRKKTNFANLVYRLLADAVCYGFFTDPLRVMMQMADLPEKINPVIKALGFPADFQAEIQERTDKAYQDIFATIRLCDLFREEIIEELKIIAPGTMPDEIFIGRFNPDGTYKKDFSIFELTHKARRILAERLSKNGKIVLEKPTSYTIFGTKLQKEAMNADFVAGPDANIAMLDYTQFHEINIGNGITISAVIQTDDGTPLNLVDIAVLDLYHTIILNAKDKPGSVLSFTTKDIYRLLNEKEKLSSAGIEEIEKSLHRLRKSEFRAVITNHIEQMASKGRKRKHEEAAKKEMQIRAFFNDNIEPISADILTPGSRITIGGQLLPSSSFVTIEKPGEQSYSQFTTELKNEAGKPALPHLLAYSLASGQMKTLPKSFYFIQELNGKKEPVAPIPLTIDRIAIRQYLLQRIYQASGSHSSISDRTILCESLYSALKIPDSRTKKQRVREFVISALDYWKWHYKQYGIGVKDYKIRYSQGKSHAIEAFVLDLGQQERKA